MVEVDRWSEGLARISIINYFGNVLLDTWVIPDGQVTNYRTWVSGVTPDKLKPENGAIPFKKAKKIAFKILEDKILIGHSIAHDF
jgi:RNA exonuclease 4